MTNGCQLQRQVLIRPAAIADVYALARTLRDGERGEAEAVLKDPRAALRASFRHSLYQPRAAFVDDVIAAMWGIGGDFLSDRGEPWLITSAAIERVPVAFVKIARVELAAMLRLKPHLENYVGADYKRAIRLLETLGFTVEAPAPLGPKRTLFCKFWIEA